MTDQGSLRNGGDEQPVSSIDALRLVFEIFGHTQDDLTGIVGEERAAKLLNGDLELTPDVAREIAQAWDIDVEMLADVETAI
jgi:antitoxin component HigA of HigAB toxin-antitoxin module